MSRPRKSYEERIFRLTLLSGLPAVLVALGWLEPAGPAPGPPREQRRAPLPKS